MNKQLLDEVLFCLSDNRQTYHYFKDKYCMFLLNHFIKQDTPVRDLKNSHLAKFCQKPLVKAWLAKQGNQHIHPDAIADLWSTDLSHYTVTLGQWGGGDSCWQQTARPGYNLVVQLNFSRSHDRLYQSLVEPSDDYKPFVCQSHPINDYRNTLAWARLDFSEDFSEVLIEEVQNDWLRYAWNAYQWLKTDPTDEKLSQYGFRPNWDRLEQYFLEVIKPAMQLWDEAILCATLEYLVEHIGAERIYMYDHLTGAALKSLRWAHPPRSLYTQLPKRFGFEVTELAPHFIEEDRTVKRKMKKIKKSLQPKWHFLNLNKGGLYAQ